MPLGAKRALSVYCSKIVNKDGTNYEGRRIMIPLSFACQQAQASPAESAPRAVASVISTASGSERGSRSRLLAGTTLATARGTDSARAIIRMEAKRDFATAAARVAARSLLHEARRDRT